MGGATTESLRKNMNVLTCNKKQIPLQNKVLQKQLTNSKRVCIILPEPILIFAWMFPLIINYDMV